MRKFLTIGLGHDHDEHDHDDHGGLHRDARATAQAMDRRKALRTAAKFGAAFGALNLIGCSASDITGTTDTGTGTGTGTVGAGTGTGSGSSSNCVTRIPEETAGPYPGDGSNGANVLNLSGVVRSDIRSSFAGLSGTATGVPLTIELTLVDASTCAVLADRAVYLWHCDRLGLYSLYSSGVTNQNYLRGVQAADASGKVRFTSIYPGCYAAAGRTSTSRCTRASRRRRASGTRSPRRRCEVADADLAGAFTQKAVQAALGVAQSTASTVLTDLQRLGYVREDVREAAAPPARAAGGGGSRGGRPATAYAFTGATRLVYG